MIINQTDQFYSNYIFLKSSKLIVYFDAKIKIYTINKVN